MRAQQASHTFRRKKKITRESDSHSGDNNGPRTSPCVVLAMKKKKEKEKQEAKDLSVGRRGELSLRGCKTIKKKDAETSIISE